MIRINVYAQNKAWLFEDLKHHFRNLSSAGESEIIISDSPLPGADAWVCLRTNEGDASPDLGRTAICVHDLFCDGGMYGPAGSRKSVRHAGALILCHPDQTELLIRQGVAIDGRPVLERPLGALKIFSPREENPPTFRIGWVGRNHVRKRLDWFTEAVTSFDLPTKEFEVVLIGEGLDGAASILNSIGIRCSYFDRSRYGIAAYPNLYKRLHCLVITSSTEAGPLPLFEALATGLAVVSTPVGWAPHFAQGFPRYVRLANSVNEIKLHLLKLHADKDAIYSERMMIARLVSEWSLDDWFREVISLARSLAVGSSKSEFAKIQIRG